MSTKMDDLLQWWLEILDKDLRGFADPRTKVDIDVNKQELTANWEVRGKKHSEKFHLSHDGDFRWISTTNGGLLYSKFLMSEVVADFAQLSNAIAGVFQPEQHYVPTRATTDTKEQKEVSDDLLLDIVRDALGEPNGKTRILFVKGDAGTGKTTLLRQLTGLQACRYKKGEAPFLFMYVSAQGRALSNLRDAISGELDDLRAGFTRDAVPALVRHGLLVPIIDGFDELLGAAGYGDAFGSLHQFLTQVEGQGVMVVSARSAFYDVEFLGRHTSDNLEDARYDVEPITLSPWQEEELCKYLALCRDLDHISESDQLALGSLIQTDRELLSKPFFASRFPEYVDAHKDKFNGQRLLDYLITDYIDRESRKIVNRDGESLVPPDAHRQLFIEATEWMWDIESRDLDEKDLKFLAEVVAETSKLSGDTAVQFVNKITSYTGFKTTRYGGQRRFRFEHDVYFDYFLSKAVQVRLSDPSKMTTFLDRGLIPYEVVQSAVDKDNAVSCLELLQLKRLPRQSVLQENRRRNLGSLVAVAFAKSGHLLDINLSDLSFINVSFGDIELRNVNFFNCIFNNVSLERARIEDCMFEECYVDSIIVSDATRLNVMGFNPGINLKCMHYQGQDYYSPSDMVALLQKLGAPGFKEEGTVISNNAKQLIKHLQSVVHVFRRTNSLCLDDDKLVRLFRNPSWSKLKKLLKDYQIVREEERVTSGRSKTFLRPQVDILNIFQYENTPEVELPDDAVGRFWKEIRSL